MIQDGLLEIAKSFIDNLGLPFEICSFVGIGSFSTVWEGKCKNTNKKVCLKIVDKFEDNEQMLVRESEAWSSMNHPNIIKLYQVIDTPSSVVFVCEHFAHSRNLLTLMQENKRPFAEEQAKGIFRQLVAALEHVHKQGYSHRDIKLENVLVSGGMVKLTDFGLAVETHEKSVAFSGSPHFSPPEVFLEIPFDPVLADVWSLGVLLHAMLTGELPFASVEEQEDLMGLVLQCDLRLHEREGLSEEAKGLLKSIMHVHPRSRAPVGMIRRSAWLMGSATHRMYKKRSSCQDLHEMVQRKQCIRNELFLGVTERQAIF